MRLLTVALFGFVLFAAVPALAQNSSHTFGTATCLQKVSCPDGAETMSSSDMAAAGNLCLQNSFGLKSDDGFFDEYSGLDANSCLVSKSTNTNDKKIFPQCCVTKIQEACYFRCQLLSP